MPKFQYSRHALAAVLGAALAWSPVGLMTIDSDVAFAKGKDKGGKDRDRDRDRDRGRDKDKDRGRDKDRDKGGKDRDTRDRDSKPDKKDKKDRKGGGRGSPSPSGGSTGGTQTPSNPQPAPQPASTPAPREEPRPAPQPDPTPAPREVPQPASQPAPEPREEPQPASQPAPASTPREEPRSSPQPEPTPEPRDDPGPPTREARTPDPEPERPGRTARTPAPERDRPSDEPESRQFTAAPTASVNVARDYVTSDSEDENIPLLLRRPASETATMVAVRNAPVPDAVSAPPAGAAQATSATPLVEFPAPDLPATRLGPFAGSFAAQQLDPAGVLAVLTGALDGEDLGNLDLAQWAPDSFLGRIAAYRDAILEGRDMAKALAEARDALAAQYPPERSVAAMQADMEAIRQKLTGIRHRLADADRLVSADEGFRLEPILADLQRLRQEREALRGELLRAMDHAQTSFMIRELEDEIRLSMDDAARQLRAASGGVVPPEVEAEVQRLLEIDDDPRAALVDAVMHGPGDVPDARLNRTALR